MNEEALTIGAGPFGLSISAYLTALSVEHRLVGRVMDTWRNRIPSGMNLRGSFDWAPSIGPAHRNRFAVRSGVRLGGVTRRCRRSAPRWNQFTPT